MKQKRTSSPPISERLLGPLIALAFLLAGVHSLSEYDITVDSPENMLWGTIYLKYFETGNKAFLKYGPGENPLIEHPIEPTNLFFQGLAYSPWEYPPVGNIISAITHEIFNERLKLLSNIDAHHIALIILSSVAIYVVYLIAYDVYGFGPAALSSSSLALYPRFIGDSHNNVKDIPVACFFVFTIYALWMAFKTKKLSWCVASGILLGLSLNTKINAYFMFVIFGLWLILTNWGGTTWVKTPYLKLSRRYLRYGYREISYPFKLNLILMGFLAGATVLATWPFLWEKPIAHLLQYLSFFASASSDVPVLYNGIIYSKATEVPFYYAPHMLLLVSPPLTLAFAFAGLWAFKGYLTSGESAAGERKKMSMLVLLWFVVPLLKYMIPGTAVHNGIRHFLEVIPPLCILAGVGGDFVARKILAWSRKRMPRRKAAVYVTLLLAILYLPILMEIYYIHPYETLYFSPIIGGVKGAEGRYEVNYWGYGIRKAANWVIGEQGVDGFVIDPMWWHLTAYYTNVSVVPQKNNYVIMAVDESRYNVTWFNPVVRNLMHYVITEKKPIFNHSVGGVPLVYVYRLKGDEVLEAYDVEEIKRQYQEQIK